MKRNKYYQIEPEVTNNHTGETEKISYVSPPTTNQFNLVNPLDREVKKASTTAIYIKL